MRGAREGPPKHSIKDSAMNGEKKTIKTAGDGLEDGGFSQHLLENRRLHDQKPGLEQSEDKEQA